MVEQEEMRQHCSTAWSCLLPFPSGGSAGSVSEGRLTPGQAGPSVSYTGSGRLSLFLSPGIWLLMSPLLLLYNGTMFQE